jgi:hypothetical protein
MKIDGTAPPRTSAARPKRDWPGDRRHESQVQGAAKQVEGSLQDAYGQAKDTAANAESNDVTVERIVIMPTNRKAMTRKSLAFFSLSEF